ncbi:hypothetical protein [Caldisericum sp. AR60]|uniref:hypothetical protein n=1 Tax=Caldisericum sp. AR60 TaxID=3397852 RepID=UPI0039FC99A8
MKNYESPTIEQAGGIGELGTWYHSETLVYQVYVGADVAAAVTRLVAVAIGEVLVVVALILLLGSPREER